MEVEVLTKLLYNARYKQVFSEILAKIGHELDNFAFIKNNTMLSNHARRLSMDFLTLQRKFEDVYHTSRPDLLAKEIIYAPAELGRILESFAIEFKEAGKYRELTILNYGLLTLMGNPNIWNEGSTVEILGSTWFWRERLIGEELEKQSSKEH